MSLEEGARLLPKLLGRREHLLTGVRLALLTGMRRGEILALERDDLTFNDLRHTWSTRAAELGVPKPVRRDILGHSSRTMTDSYTHSSCEARERAVELVSSYGDVRTAEDCVKNAERPTLWLASRTA
jgi:integrase